MLDLLPLKKKIKKSYNTGFCKYSISLLYLDMHFLPAMYCFKVTVMVILSTHIDFIMTKYLENMFYDLPIIFLRIGKH